MNPQPGTRMGIVAITGDDLTVTLPADSSLAGSVSDDGLPIPPGMVTVVWSESSGPGTVTLSPKCKCPVSPK
jgi:hypothetical protein